MNNNSKHISHTSSNSSGHSINRFPTAYSQNDSSLSLFEEGGYSPLASGSRRSELSSVSQRLLSSQQLRRNGSINNLGTPSRTLLQTPQSSSSRTSSTPISSGRDLVTYVLPFHYSHAYTMGSRATPATGVPEEKRSFLMNSKVTGGTDNYIYRNSPLCNKVDEYVVKHLGPEIEHTISKLKADKAHIDQIEVIVNAIKNSFKTNFERIRAIFKWICEYINFDDRSLNAVGSIQLDILTHTNQYTAIHDPIEVLDKRLSTSEGYASLFVVLCQKLEINAIKIKGFARGFSASLGDKLDQFNHAWNAVKLEGSWYLLDICVSSVKRSGNFLISYKHLTFMFQWCSGYVEFDRFKRSFTDQYFFLDARLFSMEHYPLNDKYLFFEPKLSKETFERVVKTSIATAALGVYPVYQEHIYGIVRTDKTYLVMPFQTRKPVKRMKLTSVQVFVKVTPLIKSERYDKKRFVFGDRFHFVQHFSDGGFRIFLLFPYPGTYNLLIFARERTDDIEEMGCNYSTRDEHTKEKYDMIYEYVLESSERLYYDVAFVEQCETMSLTGGRIEAPIQGSLIKSGTYQFRYRVHGYVMVMVKIGEKISTYLRGDPEDPDLFQGDVYIEPYVQEFTEGMYITVNGYNEIQGRWIPFGIYRVYSTFPELEPLKLEFVDANSVLKRYSNDTSYEEDRPISQSNTHQNLFQKFSPLVNPDNYGIEIKLLSHYHLLVSGDTGSYTVAIQCKNRNVRFEPLPLEYYGCVLPNRTTWLVRPPKASEYYFRVECPVPGIYVFKVRVYVRESNKKTTSFITLRYIIDCSTWNMKTIENLDLVLIKKERLNLCYPRVSLEYINKGCVLFEPMEVLYTQRSYFFKIYVPNEESVGVFCNGEWTPLKKLRSSSGNMSDLYLDHTFEGEVFISSGHQGTFPINPFVSICFEKKKTHARSDIQGVIRLCEFKVARSGTNNMLSSILSEYDDRTLVDPSPEMLKHIRFVSHKRKKISVNSKEATHDLTLHFKRIVFDNKYINKNRYRLSSRESTYHFLDEEDREKIIQTFPSRYRSLLASANDDVESMTKDEVETDRNNDSTTDITIVLLKAKLYDEIKEIENAVLVQQDITNIFEGCVPSGSEQDKVGNTIEYHQVRVKLPQAGRYLLKISIVIIDAALGCREECDGVNYWIHFNEQKTSNSEEGKLVPESEHDRDLSLSKFVFGENYAGKADKYFKLQKELHGNNGSDGDPTFIPFTKHQSLENIYSSFVNKNPCFGYVQLDPSNSEWFRVMIFEPLSRTMISGRIYRVKLRVYNTDSVFLCASIKKKRERNRRSGYGDSTTTKAEKLSFYWEKEEANSSSKDQDDYIDWQQLDNSSSTDEMIPISGNDRNVLVENVWEGVVSFKRGNEVHVMARCGYEHYISVASWLLIRE